MFLRAACDADIPKIWEILQQAIAQRKAEGSEQWQNGYPNESTVEEDLASNFGYVLEDEGEVVAYAAILFEEEPAYSDIKGAWLSEGDSAVVHRVATSNAVKGKGVATRLFRMIEDLCVSKQVFSIKVDTNFDNAPMLRILEKLGYSYCGEVFFIGAPRMAFEKLLVH
ncbi:GNAT family N-acetyltransferase [Algoriphagus sp. H41]|uniref:GNAT family N-acetyltransferase n=1 Tax=Algoriphagus oliviformis TaxID=2811231 RepID=A0ABS3C4X6_9BACT|nr:GNAT family N-acetyltransferase [Algoriphagus oliviformis]MBN7811216.1 GNAT family N-acetyltransferase [Algoriphagus oliviformis]